MYRKYFDIWSRVSPDCSTPIASTSKQCFGSVFIWSGSRSSILGWIPIQIRIWNETLRATPSVVLQVYELDTFRLLVSTADSSISFISLPSSRARQMTMTNHVTDDGDKSRDRQMTVTNHVTDDGDKSHDRWRWQITWQMTVTNQVTDDGDKSRDRWRWQITWQVTVKNPVTDDVDKLRDDKWRWQIRWQITVTNHVTDDGDKSRDRWRRQNHVTDDGDKSHDRWRCGCPACCRGMVSRTWRTRSAPRASASPAPSPLAPQSAA